MKRLAFFIALMLCAAVAYGQTGTERDASGRAIDSEFHLEVVLVANE